MVNRDELGTVGKGRLDLDVVDHLRHALHHLGGVEDRGARLHQLGDRAPVAGALHDEIGNEGDGLRVVEFHPSCQPVASDLGGHGDEELVFLAGREEQGGRPEVRGGRV